MIVRIIAAWTRLHGRAAGDQLFKSRFEACELPPPFGHREHVRLAYVYLTELDVDTAHQATERALTRYLEHHGIDPAKYHETLTQAWLLAVRHFMEICSESNSADAFVIENRGCWIRRS
jgi:hypothetical protein